MVRRGPSDHGPELSDQVSDGQGHNGLTVLGLTIMTYELINLIQVKS